MAKARVGGAGGVRLAAALGFPKFMQLPLVGDVDNRFRAPVAQIDSPRFGKSEGLPFVMEIVVDGEKSEPANVGRKVDQVFFKDRGKLLFNVSFACGKPQGFFRRGVYGDPRSIWFNVFFGYYEIDVKKSVWKRPFGYEEDGRTIRWDDILRIGKSDWNYFSNWLYGVPDEAIDPTNDLEHPKPVTIHHGRRPVNGKAWDVLEMDDVMVVSAYDSGRAGEKKLVDRELWSLLWRASFGFPLSKDVCPEKSFFAVPMKAKLYMYFRERKDNDLEKCAYQTFLFGGTINKWYSRGSPQRAQENEEFLEEQMRAVERVMREKDFHDLGF
jgi:hypothetical protein